MAAAGVCAGHSRGADRRLAACHLRATQDGALCFGFSSRFRSTACQSRRQLRGARSSPCPSLQGGLLPRHDWESLDRDWLSPVSRGSQLQDFALQGPVDVFLTQPTALQVGRGRGARAGWEFSCTAGTAVLCLTMPGGCC